MLSIRFSSPPAIVLYPSQSLAQWLALASAVNNERAVLVLNAALTSERFLSFVAVAAAVATLKIIGLIAVSNRLVITPKV